MSQWDMLKPDSLCNESYIPGNLNCTIDYCACTHVIKLKLNSIVELVFVDQGMLNKKERFTISKYTALKDYNLYYPDAETPL